MTSQKRDDDLFQKTRFFALIFPKSSDVGIAEDGWHHELRLVVFLCCLLSWCTSPVTHWQSHKEPSSGTAPESRVRHAGLHHAAHSTPDAEVGPGSDSESKAAKFAEQLCAPAVHVTLNRAGGPRCPAALGAGAPACVAT